MPMSPEQIVRGLGEARTRGMFAELTAEAMKKVLREAKIPTVRLASHTSTRKRNEDWANRMWRVLGDEEAEAATAATTLLFEWLTRFRRPMLAEFLDGIEVKHDHGLTDADFMQTSPPDKLIEAGRKLLERFDKAEVSAYLAFLDASNKSEIFAPLGLDAHLGG